MFCQFYKRKIWTINSSMPYMNKKQMDEVVSKAEEILEYFSISHYYKVPHEKEIIQNTKDILEILKKD